MARRTQAEILAWLAEHHTHVQTTVGPANRVNAKGRPLWRFVCTRDPAHGEFEQTLADAHRLYNCPACSAIQQREAARKAFAARAATYEATRRRQLNVIQQHIHLETELVESLAKDGFRTLKDVPCKHCGQLLTCTSSQLKHIADDYKYGACPVCRENNAEYRENLRKGHEARRSTLSIWQDKLDTHLGKNLVRLEPPGIGVDGVGVFTCLVNESHGNFEKSLNSVLHYRRGCPSCYQAKKNPHTAGYREAYEQGLARNAQGGWLYRIDDRQTGLAYWGITKGTVEARFSAHRTSRKDRHPLYRALQSRPADFSVEAVAFYFTDQDLAKAENEAIRVHNTRWPNGYNIDCGGVLNGKKQAWGKLTEDYIRQQPALTDTQKALLRRGLQATADTLGVSLATLKNRIKENRSASELFSHNCAVQVGTLQFDSAAIAIKEKRLPVSHYSQRRAELFKQGLPLRHRGGHRVRVHGVEYPSIAVASHVLNVDSSKLRKALSRQEPWISRIQAAQ